MDFLWVLFSVKAILPWEDIPKGVRSKLSKRKASRETGNSSSDSESDRDSVGSAKKARWA